MTSRPTPPRLPDGRRDAARCPAPHKTADPATPRLAPADASHRASVLAPHECTIMLVTFVPFLTGRRSEELPSGEQASTHPSASRRLRTVEGRTVDRTFLPLLADLELWAYAETFKDQLRERLPCRTVRISPAIDLPPVSGLPPGAEQDALALLDLWSFDVGLATFAHRITVDETATWEQLRSDITSAKTKTAFEERAAQLVAAARASGVAVLAEGDADVQHPGTPLWAQEMLVVEAGREVGLDALDDVARRLSGDGERLLSEADRADVALRLGIEACLVSNPGALALRNALGRVVAAQTAIWAAAIDLDRLLGTLLGQEGIRGLTLQDLEERSIRLLNVFERVQRFRSEVDIVPLHLAAQDKMVWTRVNEEWSLGDQLSSLDTKLNAVDHVYTHLANALTARRARALNGVVLAITTLNFAAFVVTAWEFVQKRFDPFDSVSLLVVLGALVLSALLFWAASSLSNRWVHPSSAPRRSAR